MDIVDTTSPVAETKSTTSLLESVQDSKEEDNNMLVTGLCTIYDNIFEVFDIYRITHY